MQGSKNFTRINDSFTCEHCHKFVAPADKTCRNHCPHCLYSKHVDKLPGDRANPCKGLLKPIGYELDSKKGIVLIFECQRCHERTRNKALTEEQTMPDDYDLILSLTP